MRLFIAILPDAPVRSALAEGQDCLRRRAIKGSFPHREDLHLTLAFLGETENVTGAKAALAKCRFSPFDLTLTGSGGNFGELWWAGIAESRPLAALAEELARALAAEGFRLEERPFLPHITLARHLKTIDPPELILPRRTMTVTAVRLMASEPNQKGPRYREIARAEG